MRERSLRIRSRGKLALASLATFSMTASTPALLAVIFSPPPRMKRPAATVWLPSRRLIRTLSPLTSNSVTSAAWRAITLWKSGVVVADWVACPRVAGASRAINSKQRVTGSKRKAADWEVRPPIDLFSFLCRIAFIIRAEKLETVNKKSQTKDSRFEIQVSRFEIRNSKCKCAILLSDQNLSRQLCLLLSLFGDQSQADVRLALNIRRHVAADIRARGAAQIAEITAKVIDTGRRPPKAERLCVLVKLFARIEIVCLHQSLRALELLVGVVILVVEMRDLVIDGAQRCLSLVGCGLRDDVNGAGVSLRVITNRHAVH